MTKETYSLWVNYHLGNILLSELNEKQKKEIIASEFAMNLLVPTDVLIKTVGGKDKLFIAVSDEKLLVKLSEYFRVERNIILFKLQSLIRKEKIEDIFNKKVKSVDDKIITLK